MPPAVAVAQRKVDEERKSQFSNVKNMLGQCPKEFTGEEWRVVQALLDPCYLQKIQEPLATRRHRPKMAMALSCFPTFPPSSAVIAFEACSNLPHVRQLVEAVRALETIDLYQQREILRESLYSVLRMHTALDDLKLTKPSDAAKVGLAVVAAAKALQELDFPRPVPNSNEPQGRPASIDADPTESLMSQIDKAVSDLTARKPIIDAEAS